MDQHPEHNILQVPQAIGGNVLKAFWKANRDWPNFSLRGKIFQSVRTMVPRLMSIAVATYQSL